MNNLPKELSDFYAKVDQAQEDDKKKRIPRRGEHQVIQRDVFSGMDDQPVGMIFSVGARTSPPGLLVEDE